MSRSDRDGQIGPMFDLGGSLDQSRGHGFVSGTVGLQCFCDHGDGEALPKKRLEIRMGQER